MTNACTVSSNPTYANPVLELIPAIQNLPPDAEFSIPLPLPFKLDHGVIEQPTHVQARLIGPENAPVILTLGGISANRHACELPVVKAHSQNGQHQKGQDQTGWWPDIVGVNRAINTQRFRVLSFDFLPAEADEGSGNLSTESEALNLITPADQARIAAVVCEALNIPQLYAFVGASYGGMIALNFARLFPERLQRLVVLCASHRAHPMGCAWRSIQRKIVKFGLDTQQPDRALSLARELGMTTYRTAQEFGHRFSSQSDVQHYLESRGLQFIGRMSPTRYLALSQSIDLHQVDPQAVRVPTTLIGFRQDQLVPVEDLRFIAQQLPHLAGYFETDSIYGHDAFLKEIDFLENAFRQTLI
jgi:homoserine O-acetyltransferase